MGQYFLSTCERPAEPPTDLSALHDCVVRDPANGRMPEPLWNSTLRFAPGWWHTLATVATRAFIGLTVWNAVLLWVTSSPIGAHGTSAQGKGLSIKGILWMVK